MNINYSSISYKAVRENSDLRIDAQFYNPKALKIHENIKSKNNILFSSLIVKISSGQNLPQDEKGQYKFVRTKNIKSMIIEDSGMSYTNELQGLQPITEGELLFVRVGEPGNNCIVTKAYQGESISDNILRIKLKNINPYFCSAFFNSKSGKIYFNRVLKGTAQGLISQENFNEILVPLFSEKFQNLIQSLVLTGESYIEESKKKYSKAEQLLFAEINLEEKHLKHELTFTKRMNEIKTSSRIDAEHYQPKYENVINAIKSYKAGFEMLGNLVNFCKSKEVGKEAYEIQGIPFTRVSNLSKFGITNNNMKYISPALYKQLFRHQPQKGDILLSKDATPGIAYYINEEPEEMITSGGILRLRTIDNKILPECLTIVLNSLLVQSQVEADAGGSIIKHWRPDQIEKVKIPNLGKNAQIRIKEEVNNSFKNRNLSMVLLETATSGVEIAIEKDEKEAEKWINAELKRLNITL